MKSVILLITLFFVGLQISYAEPGELDLSFGINGIVTAPGGGVRSGVVQSDEKILLIGNNGGILRYNSTGIIDNTFGTNGVVVTGFDVKSIEIMTNDKFVVVGNTKEGPGTLTADIVVARFNADGSPDNTFNGNGRQITDFASNSYDIANSIAIQSDGKIVLCGQVVYNGNIPFLMRYDANGNLDNTFDGDGKLVVNLRALLNIRGKSILLQDNAKILFISSIYPRFNTLDIAVFRFNSNGSLDSTFDGDGSKTIDLGYLEINTGFATLENGKIILAGQLEYPKGTEDCYIVRLNDDGSFDATFSNDGKLLTDFGLKGEQHFSSITLSEPGKMLIGGDYQNNTGKYLVLARFTAEGTLDTTFSGDGRNVIPGSGTINELKIFNDKLYAVRNPNGLVRFQLYGGTNKAPKVTLLTPPANSTYLAGGNVYLTAAASDEDGTISKMEFYKGNSLLYTATDTPYAFKWEHVNSGNYNLTAKATDNSGLATTSVPVNISVVPNKPPTVSIINPADNQTFLKGGTIHLEAAAKDPDGRITKVEFYNGTMLLATERKLPYNYDWAKVQAGNYTITAKATDNWGAVTISAITVSVVSNKLPSVSIINPANGESFTAYSTINLQAAAKDPDGRIIKVDFYNGTTLLASERKLPFTYQWTNARAGSYIITAVAQDNWGAKTISAPVQIFVVGGAQCPVTSQPTFGFNFNGTDVANINNGIADSSESASISVCAGEEYTTSGHFNSSSSTLYDITDVTTGGTLLFDGSSDYNRVITAAELSATAGTYTVTLADPQVGGTLQQTITPFSDLNNNEIRDDGDCAGDPIVFTYTATPCTTPVCPVTSQPTFSFNFNGTDVANINNDISDSSESASVTLCDGGQYTETGRFHSSLSTLYDLDVVHGGGTLLFNGSVAANAVITADYFNGLEGTVTVTLADPNVGGTLIQTITPFTDLNNNGILDDGDCAGDPIVFYYSATPCITPVCPMTSKPTFGYNFNGASVANINNDIFDSSESASVSVCDGGQYTETGHFHSSSANLYNLEVTSNGGIILVNGHVPAGAVITAALFNSFAGTQTLTLADPNIGGTFTQAITPFTDLNNNGILDDGDCAGEPVVLYYTVTSCPVSQCPASSQPTFGFNFNGIPVANINNGNTDPGEAASVTLCDGGEYTESERFHSSLFNLYNITYVPGGSNLFFNGVMAANAVITATEYNGYQGKVTVVLGNPDAGGTLEQTITPFRDLNNNGVLDNGDCAGDPIVINFTAIPCDLKGASISGKKLQANNFINRNDFVTLKLAPNPAKSILNIYMTGLQKNTQTSLSVLSASGVIVKTVNIAGSTQPIVLNVSSFISGTYTIRIISDGKMLYKKFVKL